MLHKLSHFLFHFLLPTSLHLAKGVMEGPYEKGTMAFSINSWLIYETQISKNMLGVFGDSCFLEHC